MVSEPIAHGHHEMSQGHGHEAAHASNQTYVRIALILAVITAMEVIVYYMPSARPILVPVLLILSVAKFAAVVGYFMHLKYDSPIFRFMFIAGLVVSLSVFIAMLAMFWTASTFFPFLQPLAGG